MLTQELWQLGLERQSCLLLRAVLTALLPNQQNFVRPTLGQRRQNGWAINEYLLVNRWRRVGEWEAAHRPYDGIAFFNVVGKTLAQQRPNDDFFACRHSQGRIQSCPLGGNPFLFPPPPSPSFRSMSPLSPARRSGELCKLPQRGLGRSPSRNRIWCILALKSGLILMVFRRINWPNFVQLNSEGKSGPCVLFVQSKIFHYCEYKHPWRSSQRVTSGDVTVDVYTLFLQRQKWQSKFRMHIIQCPYTYEHKQHISKKCNGIASISNSLLAAVVKVAKCFTWRSLDSVFFPFRKSFNDSLCIYRNIPVNVQERLPSQSTSTFTHAWPQPRFFPSKSRKTVLVW